MGLSNRYGFNLPTDSGPGSSGAPVNATYITQTPNGTLTGEQALSTLATGYMKVTNGTGVVSSQAVPIPITDTSAGSMASQNATNVGITGGTITGISLLSLGGNLSLARQTNFGAGNQNVLAADFVCFKTAITPGGDTFNLPALASVPLGHTIIIKDVSGQAGADNLTIDPDGAESINGGASYVINTNYGSAIIVSSGGAWWVI